MVTSRGDLLEVDYTPEEYERYCRGEPVARRGEVYYYRGQEAVDRLERVIGRLQRRQEAIRARLAELRPRVQAAREAELRRRGEVAELIHPQLVVRDERGV